MIVWLYFKIAKFCFLVPFWLGISQLINEKIKDETLKNTLFIVETVLFLSVLLFYGK